MFQTFLFIALLTLAIFVVLSDNLRHSIIYLGVFSLVMALAYLHFNAPDVALAEAAIGVGLSTVMYLVALKKIKIYDICYVNEIGEFNDEYIFEFRHQVIRPLEEFIEQTEEVEPQVTYTDNSIEQVIAEDNHDFIIQQQGEKTYLYGQQSDSVFRDVVENIHEIIPDMVDIEVVYLEGVNLYGAQEE